MLRRWSGDRVKAARLAAGIARPEEAAERLGVHIASVYRWEAGTEPQLRHASALADLYGITLDSLFVVHDCPNGNCPEGGSGKTDGPEAAAAKRSHEPAREGA